VNPDPRSDQRSRNLRTALILLSIAMVFFAGVIAKYWLFDHGQ
jgi:hypothetical protein